MDIIGETRFEAFVEECRAKLPQLTVTTENAAEIFRNSTIFEVFHDSIFLKRTRQKVITIPFTIVWGESSVKNMPLRVSFELKVKAGSVPVFVPSTFRDFFRNKFDKEKLFFLITEPIVHLPLPPWVNQTTGRRWCFADEEQSIVERWFQHYMTTNSVPQGEQN